jgi:malate synthase
MSDRRLQARLDGHCARCLRQITKGQWVVEAEHPRAFHGYKLTWSHAVCPSDLVSHNARVDKVIAESVKQVKSQVMKIVDGKVVYEDDPSAVRV